jgi:hypothetical protein
MEETGGEGPRQLAGQNPLLIGMDSARLSWRSARSLLHDDIAQSRRTAGGARGGQADATADIVDRNGAACKRRTVPRLCHPRKIIDIDENSNIPDLDETIAPKLNQQNRFAWIKREIALPSATLSTIRAWFRQRDEAGHPRRLAAHVLGYVDLD